MKAPLTFISFAALIGCATPPTQEATRTAVGAGAGALAGGIAGNNIDGISKTEGAIAGAIVGGLLGNQMGRQQDQINTMQGQIAQTNRTVVNVRNSNGSTTPVVLHRAGDRWQGPRGELYDNLPDEFQLRDVYGF